MTKIRVMLVDDSAIVRGLMQRALKADDAIEIVATAVDGQMALDVLKRTPVDIIILDIEMPVMDGLSALPEMLKISPNSRVIMASTLTMRNAEISMRAMELGASDYLAKPSASAPNEVEEFYRQLISKVKALAPVAAPASPPAAAPIAKAAAASVKPVITNAPAKPAAALAIASSTGGPQALLAIFQQLKGKIPRVPIFITQHMPANFTTILAEHISKAIGCDCHEGKDGEVVKPGVIYVAPGDHHMVAEKSGMNIVIRINQDAPENFCRPAADPMFRSLARIYKDGLLAAVLTGIGADGTKGAGNVVESGGTVIAQDEQSSVVYGMPRAVAEAKLVSAVLPIGQIAPYFAKAVMA